MSSKSQHLPRPPPPNINPNTNARSPDIQGARTLASFLAQHTGVAPAQRERESTGAQASDAAFRHPGAQQDMRSMPQAQRSSHPRESPRARDAGSHSSSQHSVPGPSRRYHPHPSQSQSQSLSPAIQQHRHPNLSLDTRNLHGAPTTNPNSGSRHHSQPSPFPPSARPPSFSPSDSPASASASAPSPLHADLTALKSGLESLWTASLQKLQFLHSTIAQRDESLHALAHSSSRLEAEYHRVVREGLDAEEARRKALRERDMLSAANARLWEDKARLEGEKRELRAKVDAGAEVARVWREVEQVGKGKGRENGGSVRVKVEDGEAEVDGGYSIPLAQMEEIIEKRLKSQADDFARETKDVNDKLIHSQTRITELEAQLKRYSAQGPGSANVNGNGTHSFNLGPNGPNNPHGIPNFSRTTITPSAPPGSARQASHPGHSTHNTQGHNRSGKFSRSPLPPASIPSVSPVTPHTALPSSFSETDREREQEFCEGEGEGGREQERERGQEFPFVNVKSRGSVAGVRRLAPLGPREVHAQPQPISQRTVSGPVESDRDRERARVDIRPRRVSAPTQNPHTEAHSYTGKRLPSRSVSGSVPVSHPGTPIMDPMHLGKPTGESGREKDGGKYKDTGSERDAQGQVVSTYGGVGAGWRPAPGVVSRSKAGTGAAQSPARAPPPHSRPTTPERPSKRARTVDLQDDKPDREEGAGNGETGDVEMAPAEDPPAPAPEEDQEQSARDMTADERLMFSSLSRVLVKKRDGDGWKCVMCKQEKKGPTATFSETTPIGVVTQHVKESHKTFWADLRDGGGARAAAAP